MQIKCEYLKQVIMNGQQMLICAKQGKPMNPHAPDCLMRQGNCPFILMDDRSEEDKIKVNVG